MTGALFLLGSVGDARGFAETDALVDESFRVVKPVRLVEERGKRAEALAHYMQGVMIEFEEGSGAALGQYKKVLAVDSSNLDLAIFVARESLREGDTAGALAVIKDAAKARPEDAMPVFLLAEIYWKHLHKKELAESYAKKAYRFSPGDPDMLGLLWDIYWKGGAAAKARLLLEAALRREDENPDYWMRIAELQWWMSAVSSGKEEEAGDRRRRLFALGKVVDLSGDAEILAKVGDVYTYFQEVGEAAKAYRKAYGIDSDVSMLGEKLGAALVRLGEKEEAFFVLGEVVKRNPNDLAAYDQLVLFALEKGDTESALLYRQQALVLDQQNFMRNQELIDLLLAEGKGELAVFYLEQAVARFPKSGVFPYGLALTLTRLGRGEEALSFFDQALSDSMLRGAVLSSDFYYEYGVAAEKAGRIERAEELFLKAISAAEGGHAVSCNFLAYMWIDRNENLDEAERLLKIALKNEPKNPAYLDSLGWLYYRKGDFGKSLVLLLESAELMPYPDAVVYDHIAEVYFSLGKYPESLLYWEKSLEISPEGSAVRKKIEGLREKMASGGNG